MLSFVPRDVLDEIWDLIESVSESFLPSRIPCKFIVQIGLSSFPFTVWDKLWVLIRPVLEVSLLI